jgi:hypothetical protein
VLHHTVGTSLSPKYKAAVLTSQPQHSDKDYLINGELQDQLNFLNNMLKFSNQECQMQSFHMKLHTSINENQALLYLTKKTPTVYGACVMVCKISWHASEVTNLNRQFSRVIFIATQHMVIVPLPYLWHFNIFYA